MLRFLRSFVSRRRPEHQLSAPQHQLLMDSHQLSASAHQTLPDGAELFEWPEDFGDEMPDLDAFVDWCVAVEIGINRGEANRRFISCVSTTTPNSACAGYTITMLHLGLLILAMQ